MMRLLLVNSSYVLALLLGVLTTAPSALGQHEQAYSFNAVGGSNPASALVADSLGNLYGTASTGGQLGSGSVFEFSPPSQPARQWTKRVLYNFAGTPDGSKPIGTSSSMRQAISTELTFVGGASGCGTVFELLAPTNVGGKWTEKVLYSFGAVPNMVTDHSLGWFLIAAAIFMEPHLMEGILVTASFSS